ncbi:hypothetical protein V496_02421 [Pseudogymnoascus sp. VKM F-4515 (FW-2607)]|nr:hypothetical protein V496_02421 [Pseudogymnoascus sp. VKM F-4515 (FW-2607)]
MCPYPSSGDDSRISGVVEDVGQLLLTHGNVQGARVSGYDNKKDGVLKYMKDAKAKLNEQQHKGFIQLMHDSMIKDADISGVNQRKSVLFAEFPELEKGFNIFYNLLTPTTMPTPKNTSDVLSQFGTTQHLCQQSEPIDTPTMLLSVHPPELSLPLVALYPPITVQVLNATMDMRNFSAFATLYRDGREVTKLLLGKKSGDYFDGYFSLFYRGDFVNCVYSHTITVGDRLLATSPIGDGRRQLYWQNIDANFKNDDTGLFPTWKLHTGSSVVAVEKERFTKVMVFVPQSEFKLRIFDDGFYGVIEMDGLGGGLFTDDDGLWYDDGEAERNANRLDPLVHSGTDGELYRKKQGMFKGAYVALERRTVWIENSLYIAHIVLL